MMTRAKACATLGIPIDHTLEQLKRAHRKAVRVCHPDMTGDPKSQAAFIKVQSAYDFLSGRGDAERYEPCDDPKPSKPKPPPPPPPPPPEPARIIIKTVKRTEGRRPILRFEYFTYPIGGEPKLFRRWERLKLKKIA